MSDRMQIAKGRIALHAGMFTALASKLEWVRDDHFPAPAGTNGRRVIYNGAMIEKWPMGDVVFLAMHEIMHNMLCHITRIGTRHKKKANIAMDIVGNAILRKMCNEMVTLKMTVPESACLPENFNVPEGLTFEATYELLPDSKCGGGNGGFDEHMEPSNDNGQPMTAAEKDALEKEWKVSVRAAADMAKKMGKLPGFMEEFVDDLLSPKVNWRAQLAECVLQTARDESSYRRFNRRHLSRDMYLPGQYSERLKHIAYFCDTSGSISSEEFKAALGAMTDILEDLQPEKISFGQCDTDLHSVEEITPTDLPLPGLKVYGRGGTDMNPAFDWACKHQDEIDAFILQTDGFVPPLLPTNIPNVPVVVICTTGAELPDGWDFRKVVRVEL